MWVPENFSKQFGFIWRSTRGNATSSDLLAAIDQFSGPGVGGAFSTFLDQAGFPLVNVKLDCHVESPHLELSQSRFLPAGSPGSREGSWEVPVCLVWSAEERTHKQCVLLAKQSTAIPLETSKNCPAWLFADANATGYYAVTYAPDAEKLAERAVPELKPEEKAAALRNVQLLFYSARGDAQQELISLIEFSRNSDPGLVRQAATSIAGVSDRVPKEQYEEYASLIRSLYQSRARELGWKPRPGESQETRLLRLEIVPLVATRGEDSKLQDEASVLARQWLKNREGLDPDLVAPVLSTVAWNGGRAFFNQLVDEIKNDKVQRERYWMIDALSSFRDPDIAQAALELLFGSGIDPRELEDILFGAPAETRDLVWSFVQQNFDRLNSTLPGARGIPFGAILPRAASGFCDASRAEQVQTFFNNRISNLPGGARNLANTLESIRLCSARAAILQPALENFLKSYHQTRNGHSDAFRHGSG